MNPGIKKEETLMYKATKWFEFIFGTFILPLNLFVESLNFANYGKVNFNVFLLALVFVAWDLLATFIKYKKKDLSPGKIKHFNTVYTMSLTYTMSSFLIFLSMLLEGYFAISFYLSLVSLVFLGKLTIFKKIKRIKDE